MSPLTALLLLALGAETKAETHYPGAAAVYQCTFESSQDDEVYGWPPNWTRRHGPGFPFYVRVRVDDRRPPPGGASLRVDLDGGAATAYGPAVSVNPDLLYVLEGYIETSGLRLDGAYISLIFRDSKQTALSSLSSEKISGNSPWQKICIGPVSPPAGAGSMLVGLHVEPQGELQDLHGSASFGALWLGQLPRVVLTAEALQDSPPQQEKPGRNGGDKTGVPRRNANDATFLLFPRGQPIEIACAVSGFAAPSYEIRLQLLDVDGRMLSEKREAHLPPPSGDGAGGEDTSLPSPTRRGAGSEGTSLPSPIGRGAGGEGVLPPSHSARMTWRLPSDVPGFYRIRPRSCLSP